MPQVEIKVEELQEIIRLHGTLYPYMEPEDLIKLIYQGEFGAEEDVSDPDKTLDKIRARMENAVEYPGEQLVTDIGGGFVRLSLQKARRAGLTPEAVNAAHIFSVAHAKGDRSRFEEKLRLASGIIDGEKLFSFTGGEFKDRCAGYRKDGGGVICHSDVYMEKYGDGYAVVAKWLTQEWCKGE